MNTADNRALASLYDFATGDEDARVCKDIPESACRHLPRNFFAHLLSLVATKTGDRLAGPKLVLAWLLSSFGGPAMAVSLLVPVRESLALLPQLLVAAWIRRMPVRKWLWVGGSIVQGAAVMGMGIAAYALKAAALGWTIVGLLVIFSLARGVCSVAAKDVIGKTVSKTRRGRLSGYASSAAGACTVGVAVLIVLTQRSTTPGPEFFAVLLAGAGLLWLGAALVYSLIVEAPGATEGGANAGGEAIASLTLLWRDPGLKGFVITRALLVSTALMAPFFVVLANRHTGGSLSELSLFLVANGIAALLSAPLWGRMADRSSRYVLVITAAAGALLGSAMFVYVLAGSVRFAEAFYAAMFFLLSVIHTGVRIGRKTYLVDMADSTNRAAYVAVSNTAIGIVLLAGGTLAGAVAQQLGVEFAVLSLAVLAALGAVSAWRLAEVQ